MEIEFDDKVVDALLKGVMENYPEASSGNSLKCNHVEYDNCKYGFYDEETGKSYKVDLGSLRSGFGIFVKLIAKGELHLDGLVAVLDGGEYDSIATDALVQCAIFGEVRYG